MAVERGHSAEPELAQLSHLVNACLDVADDMRKLPEGALREERSRGPLLSCKAGRNFRKI